MAIFSHSPEIRGLSVCSGIAGIELGLRLALGERFRTVVSVEKDPFAAATLAARMGEETLGAESPIWDDLSTFDGVPWRGGVDIVFGGIPCQSWSLAGSRRGTSDERWMWPHAVRVICETEPKLVLIENVGGFLAGQPYRVLCIHCRINHGRRPEAAIHDDAVCDVCGQDLRGRAGFVVLGSGITAVLGDLARLGFDAEWVIVGACDVGAPHLRRRIFVLGRRRSGGSGRRSVADAGRRREDGLELEQSIGRREPSGAVPPDARGAGKELADPASGGLGVERGAGGARGERHADLGSAGIERSMPAGGPCAPDESPAVASRGTDVVADRHSRGCEGLGLAERAGQQGSHGG